MVEGLGFRSIPLGASRRRSACAALPPPDSAPSEESDRKSGREWENERVRE